MSPRAGRTRPLVDAAVEGVVAALVGVNLVAAVVYRVGEVPVDEARAVAHLALAVAFAGWLVTGRDPARRRVDEEAVPVTEPDRDYAAHPAHPLARVPADALRVARGYLLDARLVEVDWDDPEDVRTVADGLVAELALGGHLRLVAPTRVDAPPRRGRRSS